MFNRLTDKKKEKILEKLKNNKLNNHHKELSKEEINKLLKFNELNPIILHFINTFNNYFDDYNSLLLTNLDKLHIYIDHEEEDSKGHFFNNNIYLYIEQGTLYDPSDEDFIDTLYHELLHASTYDENKDKLRSGFNKNACGYNLAHSLNEGYTELLTKRYFSFSTENSYYLKEQQYAEQVERLIGKSIMEKAYFEGDLYTIVTKLNEYILEPLDFIIKADNNLIDPVEVLRKIEKDKSKTLIKR